MHRWLSYTMTILLVAGCGADEGSPRVGFEEQEVVVRRAEDVFDSTERTKLVTVNIVNDSSIPVHIVRIKTSCGCTIVGDVGQPRIEPRSKLPVELNVTLPEIGKKSVVVSALCAEKAVAPFEMVLVADAGIPNESHIVSCPATVRVRGYTPGELLEGTFELQTYELTERPWLAGLHCLNATTEKAPELRVVQSEVVDGVWRRTYASLVKVRAPDRVGGRDRVAFGFNGSDGQPVQDKRFPVIELLVVTDPPVVCVPSELFVDGEVGERLSVTILLSDDGDWKCAISSVPECVTAEFVDERATKRSRNLSIQVTQRFTEENARDCKLRMRCSSEQREFDIGLPILLRKRASSLADGTR